MCLKVIQPTTPLCSSFKLSRVGWQSCCNGAKMAPWKCVCVEKVGLLLGIPNYLGWGGLCRVMSNYRTAAAWLAGWGDGKLAGRLIWHVAGTVTMEGGEKLLWRESPWPLVDMLAGSGGMPSVFIFTLGQSGWCLCDPQVTDSSFVVTDGGFCLTQCLFQLFGLKSDPFSLLFQFQITF